MRAFWSRRTDPRNEEGTELDRAIAAWRTLGPGAPRLSEARRERVLAAARRMRRRGENPSPQAALFLPGRRLALAAALPVAALTLAIGALLVHEGALRPAARDDAPRVEAMKQDGEVIFVIADGKREHRVSRSSRPNGLGPSEVFTTRDGRFRDRLDSGSSLVFYRID